MENNGYQPGGTWKKCLKTGLKLHDKLKIIVLPTQPVKSDMQSF